MPRPLFATGFRRDTHTHWHIATLWPSLLLSGAVQNLCSHGASDKICDGLVPRASSESKFACAFLRRRAESPSRTTTTTTTKMRICRWKHYQILCIFFPIFSLSFYPTRLCVCLCLQSLFYLMHKSAGKIYKNCLSSEEYGDLDCIGPQVGWADGDDDVMMAPIEKLKFSIMANLIRQKFHLIYKASAEDFLINNKSGEFRNNKKWSWQRRWYFLYVMTEEF